MSKKSRKRRQKQTKRPARKRSKSKNTTWIILATLGLLVLVGAFWWMARHSAPGQPADSTPTASAQAEETPTSEPTPPPNIGAPTGCIHRPAFVSQLNLGNQIYIGTNLKGYTGLTLSAQQPDGRVTVYQHPTWDDAGSLAAYVLDQDGNIYVAPAPFVSLDENPPQEQNNIYKVDARTGVMSLYMTLPWAAPPDTRNPFGILGLTYDCDTHSLYASSVAGSTYDEELGRIFQIDPTTASIVSQMDGVDAFGLGVYRGVKDKRLYFGSARNSSIRSVVLDDAGALDAEQRLEFYLLQAPGGQDERAKKIQFPKRDEMLVKGIEFNYTLRAASDFAEHDYTYRYDPANDAWEFVQVKLREGVQ